MAFYFMESFNSMLYFLFKLLNTNLAFEPLIGIHMFCLDVEFHAILGLKSLEGFLWNEPN